MSLSTLTTGRVAGWGEPGHNIQQGALQAGMTLSTLTIERITDWMNLTIINNSAVDYTVTHRFVQGHLGVHA